MKQILLTTLCCIVISTLFAQKPDTATTDSWTGSTWVHASRSINTYDGNCVLQTSLIQGWQAGSSTWADTLLTTYTYNGNGQVTQMLFQFWTGSAWTNVFRTRNVFTGSVLDTTYLDNWTGSTWKVFTRTTFTYNVDNTVYQELTELKLIGWTNSSQNTFFYNSDKTINYDSSQTWSTNKWVNSAKLIYTYNGSGKQTQLLEQTWQSNAWANQLLTTYTLNGNGDPSVALDQQWNGSSWDNYEQTTYHYNSCISLPLTLLNFSAAKNNNTVSLNWKTTNEVNTSHFIVQRSTDGIHYSNVGQVTAKGGNVTATNDYSYSDNISTIKTGTVYYRLQMIDKDGRSSTSKVASITINANGIEFSIKPNPAKNFIIITAGSAAGSSALVSVTDFAGHVVIKKTISTTSDQTIDISSLQRGVYIVSIKAGEITTTKKLVVE